MLGIFICFVLPGLLAGLLLSQASRAATSVVRRKRRRRQAHAPARVHAQPDKNRLFVYDLREDFSERTTAA